MKLVVGGIVQPVWKGGTVVCLGDGPSLSKSDVDYCRGKAKIIAVNDAYRLAPWADVLYGCDGRWWRWHPDAVKFSGEKVTQDSRTSTDNPGIERIECVTMSRKTGHRPVPGFSVRPDRIHAGQNGGYQAANIAYLSGAAVIVLLGYDMQVRNGKTHWFGDHPNGDKDTRKYQRWVENFATVAQQLPELGIRIVNCTRETALRCFEVAELKDALDRA